MIEREQNKEKEKSMIELTCKVCDDVTITCDEGVASVTCSSCVMNTNLLQFELNRIAEVA